MTKPYRYNNNIKIGLSEYISARLECKKLLQSYKDETRADFDVVEQEGRKLGCDNIFGDDSVCHAVLFCNRTEETSQTSSKFFVLMS